MKIDPSQLYQLNSVLPHPEEAMLPYNRIPEQDMNEIKPGKMFECYISNVTDPSDFHIQLKSTEPLIRQIMYEMAQFYDNPENLEKYKIRGIEPGIEYLPCAALYFSYDRKNEGWHRAIIIEIWDFESVDVFFIDYGTVSKVFLHHCRFLDKRFGKYKAQAIHAKCGGIKPKKTIKGVEPFWTDEGRVVFKRLCDATNSVPAPGVVAILMSKKKLKAKLILYDTVTNDLPDGIIINDRLIRDGFAKKNTKWTKQGLLPWEHPYEQLRQKDLILYKELVGAMTNPPKSEPSLVEVELVYPPAIMKQSVDKVNLWFDKIDMNAVNEYDIGDVKTEP